MGRHPHLLLRPAGGRPSIITGCKWIEEEHRAQLLEELHAIHWFVLVEIDQRLRPGAYRQEVPPPLENSTPPWGPSAPPARGRRSRSGEFTITMT